jgi:galactose mutarotase-like enzyme
VSRPRGGPGLVFKELAAAPRYAAAMFSIRAVDGVIPTLELADEASGGLAVLAPSRGGILARLRVSGREVLYLDQATFDDRSANVRGGSPVLFPSPGKLTADSFSWNGVHGAMKQHGFARNLPWEVVSTSTQGAASATLRLTSSEATRAQYPWDFTAEYTYSLRDRALGIEMLFTNHATTPMPFGAGFHPYFAVPDADKVRVRIPTPATRAFDNTGKREIDFNGFDLTLPEVDLHLLDHGGSEASISVPGGLSVALRGSPELTRWVIWTLKGRDFVCLEPWTCPGNALNTGEGLLVLAPGETRALRLEMLCS